MKVFVYGTLKSGNTQRGLHLFPGAKKQGNATTTEANFSLIDLGAFPAVVPDGNIDVAGEVWEVDDDTMEILDSIEGYPTFYNRRPTQTTLGEAWMYYMQDPSKYEHDKIEPNNGVCVW